VVGCNTNGIIAPGQCKLGGIGGDLPARVFVPGPVGIVSRSGGMSAELALTLKAAGHGVSTAVSMGGDIVPCTPMVRYMTLFDADPATEAIILFGEPGTPNEQEVAEWLAARGQGKPVIAVLAGEFQERYPAGASFGHAAAMIQDVADTVSAKRTMLSAVGVHIVRRLGELGPLLARLGVRRMQASLV
jgi:succinyl-CoA synthetase alpha subunit